MKFNRLFKKEHIKTFGILAAIGAVSILVGFITDRSICLFYNTTGIPCPGCGMTRSYLHLFKGRLAEAFHFHPLFALVVFLPFLITTDKKRYLYSAVFVLIAVWIIRLKLYYPNVEPMVYMEDNLIAFVKSLLKRL